jgi:glycosyltransferase 2 family protein
MLASFLVLTALGIAWALPDSDGVRASLIALTALGWPSLVLLGVLALAIVAAEMHRLVVIGRVMGVRVGAWASFDATIANNLLSWLTPGGALGEPAAIYMLGRHGVPLDGALLISFGKLATSLAFILVLSFLLLALGFGPAIAPWAFIPLVTAIGCSVLLMGLLVLGAFWPAATTRLITEIETWLSHRSISQRPGPARLISTLAATARGAVDRLSTFRRGGARGSLSILTSHILYYGAYVGLIVALALMFGARSTAALVPVAVIYLGFLYIAPTPGASGLAEASAVVFFGSMVPEGNAFVVVVLFRALTCYLHVLFGVVYLPLVGALRGVLSTSPRAASA